MKNHLEDETKLKAAQNDLVKLNTEYHLLNLLCTKQELDKNVKWFQ